MIFRLTAACVLALGLLTFATTAQAAPPDFTWSTSLSTAQAGGHPNVTFNYASSSTQSLTRLDVDLPEGLMHRNKLSGACSNPLYRADNCPASSTVGTVSTRLVVARVPVIVAGTIYQLSAPTDDAAASFGIVLRPPLSSFGLTSKIFIRNQLSFTNSGGLRSSLVDPPSSVRVLGASIPVRIAQLRLTYNSQTPTGNIALVSNPTSCKLQIFTAHGTYSDGDKRGHSSSYTTTGCPAVPFAPTSAVELDNNTAGERTLFSSMLHMHRPGTASSLSPGHVVAIGHDFEEIGDFDLEAIDNGVLCTEAQAASEAGCPAESAIGDLSVDIEGFGTATGKTFATNSPGHKTVNEITLRGRIKVRFPGGLGGDNDSTLSFTGIPQLPITAFRFRSTRAADYITNTCAIRMSLTTSRSWGDGHAVNQNVLPAPNCPAPTAPTITEGPDRGITINTTHVEYRFSGKEVDTAWECAKDDGPFVACASPFIDDFQGEGAHVFSVRAVRGGVAGPATTASFSIDTVPPTLVFTDAEGPFRDQSFSTSFSASDATSGLDVDKLECSLTSENDPTLPALFGEISKTGEDEFSCGFKGAPAGLGAISLTAYDYRGHVTVLKSSVIIDGSPPEIVINEKRTLYTDAPSVEVPIEIADDSLFYEQGEVNVECSRKGWDGTVKGGSKIITDRDTGRSKGFCSFADVPEGAFKVIVRGWDPVKKELIVEGDLVVDRSAPKVAFTGPVDADSDGDGIADDRWRSSSFDVAAEIEDPESGIDQGGTTCLARVVNKGAVKGNIAISQAGRVVCSLGDLPDGDVEVEITAKNYVGTVTIVKRGFTVDSTPPTVSFTDTGDLDSDGDGFSDNRFRPSRLGYEIRVDDGRGIGVDPDSGACEAKPRKGGVVTGTVIISNGSAMRCSFEGLPDGDTDIEIRAADYRGHVTVLKAAVTIEDPTPPGTPERAAE